MSDTQKDLKAKLSAYNALDPYGESHPGHPYCPYPIHHQFREPWLDGWSAAQKQQIEQLLKHHERSNSERI